MTASPGTSERLVIFIVLIILSLLRSFDSLFLGRAKGRLVASVTSSLVTLDGIAKGSIKTSRSLESPTLTKLSAKGLSL
ncbi:hypothetical protein PMIN06_003834 [Paraphaeosphaeria minitans]